jgi:EAL domain-containing protein (putative c-di-GMP-specific phosphodiesterase class I)
MDGSVMTAAMVAEANRSRPEPALRYRLLLAGDDDPSVVKEVTEAARNLPASLDIMPTLDTSLAWLLHPFPTVTHVLAPASLPIADIDALAGMVDEVTHGRACVILLGESPVAGKGAGRHGLIHIDPANADDIERLLRDYPAEHADLPSVSETDLRGALRGGRLRVRFQPVLNATSLEMTGVETLARLHHPALGILLPSQFMPRAIETGQERVLSTMAAARAVMDLRGEAFMQERTVAFNVPLPTFLHAEGPARTLEICAIAAHPVSRVVIELVETLQAPDLHELARAVENWRRAGLRVTIDDAGPRLPHWRDMLSLPFTGVKLDGSLTGAHQDDIEMAEDIVAVARKNGMTVVAEGIENDAALRRVRGIGVDEVQGYMFCRPVPVPALRIWAAAWDAILKAR